MKAPSRGMRIVRQSDDRWVIFNSQGFIVAGPYKTFKGARNKHAALSMGISYRQATRAGN